MGSTTDPTARFSNRVADYVRYRPGYPAEMIALLQRECDLKPDHVIADLGCGTGLLAKRFCDFGNRVYGVEPNQPMRAAGEEFLREYPNCTAVNGRAEATTLPDASVNFITAGEAFHWFDPEQTRREALRILRPGGWAVLAWNDRHYGPEPAMVAYEELLVKYGTDYLRVKNLWHNLKLTEFFGAAGYRKATFSNQQVFDRDGVVGRIFSASYMPHRGHPQHEAALGAANELFDRYHQDGRFRLQYDTNLYYAQLKAA